MKSIPTKRSESCNVSSRIISIQSERFNSLIESYRVYELSNQTLLNLDPVGNFEVIFQLTGGFMQRTYGTKDWTLRPSSFVGGLHSKSFQIRGTSETSKLISIVFKPLGARCFIPGRLNLYKDELIRLNDIDTNFQFPELSELAYDQLAEKLDNYLAERFFEYYPSVVDYALQLISEKNGFIPIKSLSNHLNISSSHLRKLFGEQIGMSPKAYSRILRVRQISTLLKQSNCDNLSQLSHDLGYFDQAHFIHDFKSITGRTPSIYSKK